MKLHPYLPHFAIPTGPMWMFAVRDILIAVLIVGCLLTCMWLDRQIMGAHVEAYKAKAEKWEAISDGVINGKTKAHLGKQVQGKEGRP